MNMKIGICGQMCSGKSTVAKYIVSNNKENKFVINSFAKKVKEIAIDLFNMKEKNRELLVNIGTKMREIDKDVWANFTINECKSYENVIIDDVRYLNEFNKLKEDGGWILIKLAIDPVLQLKRLKQTYPNTWETHLKYIKDDSEKIHNIPDDLFDYVIIINENNQQFINEYIDDIFKKF